MVPSAFVVMHSFPRTPNGKIDKKQLIYEQQNDSVSSKTIIAPETNTEIKIYNIWVETLKFKNISIDDNFFNIGGHSLLAISVVSKIQKTFNIEFNLRYFFDHPTIKDLSTLIEEIINPKGTRPINNVNGSSLMLINDKGNSLPFTLVHGDQANYFLSEYFGKNRPFFGFFHLGSDGEKIKFNNIQDYAKSYIDQLQTVVPSEPFLIGGYSFGGVVAFEMACQLEAMGYKVPLLVLIDSNCPIASSSLVPVTAPNSEKKEKISLFKIIHHNYFRAYFKIRRTFWNLFFILNIKLPALMRNKYINDKYNQLSRSYNVQRKYSGTTLIFKASQIGNQDGLYLDWKDFTDKINEITLEGNHESILTNKTSIETLQKTILKYIETVN